ncbi:MAG: RDD family protein [Acidobacteriota bacterium]
MSATAPALHLVRDESPLDDASANQAVSSQAGIDLRTNEARELGRAASAGSGSQAVPGLAQPVSSRPDAINYQAPLFRDSAGSPKVVPIPTLTPYHPVERESQPRSRTNVPRSPRRSQDAQQHLELHSDPRDVETRPLFEAARCCDALVALPSHRLIASAVDGTLILLAVGVVVGMFVLGGGEFAWTRTTFIGFAGLLTTVVILYRALWSMADGDTPGMRFAGLRLVDFDGRRATRNQRIIRQIAGVLSVISAGVGVVWALLDEESLTWHDHISKTFPTIGS